MANSELNLSINIEAQADTSDLSALLAVLKNLGVNVSDLRPEVNTLSNEIDTLTKQQKVVESFRSLQNEVGNTQKSFEAAKSKLRDLTTELNAVESPSQNLITAFKQTNNEVIKLGNTLERQQAQLKAVGDRFTSVGLEANSLSSAQAKITETSSVLSTKLQSVKEKLEGIAKTAEEQKKVDEALKTLGIDAEQLSTGITKTERSFISALQAIAISAQTTEEQLREALVTTLQTVKTPAALAELNRELDNIAASGRLSAEQINGLRTITEKPFPDPTGELRTGTHGAVNVMEELKQTVLGFLALDAFRRFVTETVNSSRVAESAFKGLQSVAEGTGAGIGAAYAAATKLASSGVLSLTEASISLQNLLSRGYSIEQAVQTINRLSDSAAFNRQTHLQWGEAIVGATEGLRNENSQLVDNAGVTKNVSVIWKEYADSIGKSVEELTKQEKIQAEVNGIIKETGVQAGNTDKALQGFEGSLVRMNKNIGEMKTKIGQDLTPAIISLTEGVSGLTGYLSPLIGGWDKFVVSIAYSIDKLILLKDGLFNLENPTKKIDALTQAYNQSLQDIDDRFGTFTTRIKENAAALATQETAQKSAAATAAAAANIQAQATEDFSNALKALGVSVTDVNTGMTKMERESITSLTSIASSAESNSAILSTAFMSALQKIESSIGLVKFREQLDAVIESGKLTGLELENLTRLQSAVNDTIGKGVYSLDSFRDGLNNVKESFVNSVTASDQFGQALKRVGLDAEQVLSGMDARFKEIIVSLQNLAETGKLTGAALKEALQNAIKTADSQAELKALDALIKKLGEDGKLTGSEMTLALDAVKDKLLQVADATDPVAQAFKVLGIQSHDALNQAAQDAKDAFETIRASGTATTGDLNAAFAAMAEKVIEAGKAAGPVGEAMAVAFLKAKAATAEEVAEVEKLIGTYHEAAAAAESSAGSQVAASNQVTAATKSQAAAAQAVGGIQKQQIENYNDLSEAGKKWADALIAQSVASDNARAGTAAYRNETGQTIKEIDNLISREESEAAQVEQLQEQFNAGTISAASLKFQLGQLAAQLADPITSAGASALQTLKELQQQIKDTRDSAAGTGAETETGTGTSGRPTQPILSNFTASPTEGEIVVINGVRWQFHRESPTIAYWINLDYLDYSRPTGNNTTETSAKSGMLDISGTTALKTDLADIHDWLERINTKATAVGDSIAKQVTSSSFVVQAVVKELQLQAGRAN